MRQKPFLGYRPRSLAYSNIGRARQVSILHVPSIFPFRNVSDSPGISQVSVSCTRAQVFSSSLSLVSFLNKTNMLGITISDFPHITYTDLDFHGWLVYS